jgi:molecular chaperone GrpE
MNDPTTGGSAPQPAAAGDVQAEQVRVAYAAMDPGTDGEQPSAPGAGQAAGQAAGDGGTADTLDAADAPGGSIADPAVTGASSAELESARTLAEERLADLQRLQAEFVNYRRRVERDRDVARDSAVAGVLEALLPVLDDVHLARQHGDLESGPFVAIADKLESTLGRFGLARYGQPGEPFDPTVHEALVHTQAELAEGTTDTTVVQILQPGYRLTSGSSDKVLRAARVAVADPQ